MSGIHANSGRASLEEIFPLFDNVGQVWQTTEYGIEGSKYVERLYDKYIIKKELGDGGGGGWKQLKLELGEKICVELAIHFGLTWPIPSGWLDTTSREWSEEQKDWAAAILSFSDGLVSDNITNVNIQSKKKADGEFERIVGTFLICLRFSEVSLRAHRATTRILETATRLHSGMKARGREHIAQHDRLLVYCNKTDYERAIKRWRQADELGIGRAKGSGRARGRGRGRG